VCQIPSRPGFQHDKPLLRSLFERLKYVRRYPRRHRKQRTEAARGGGRLSAGTTLHAQRHQIRHAPSSVTAEPPRTICRSDADYLLDEEGPPGRSRDSWTKHRRWRLIQIEVWIHTSHQKRPKPTHGGYHQRGQLVAPRVTTFLKVHRHSHIQDRSTLRTDLDPRGPSRQPSSARYKRLHQKQVFK